jgi:hypothetical protein
MKKRANLHRLTPTREHPVPMESDFFVSLILKGLESVRGEVGGLALFWGFQSLKTCSSCDPFS